MKYTPYISRKVNEGTQDIYRFDNGYGASVVSSPYSYRGDRGLFELAVIKFNGGNWNLTYDTPITDDVLGYLKPKDVKAHLDAIQALPKDGE